MFHVKRLTQDMVDFHVKHFDKLILQNRAKMFINNIHTIHRYSASAAAASAMSILMVSHARPCPVASAVVDFRQAGHDAGEDGQDAGED